MEFRRLGRTGLMVSSVGLGSGSRMFMERGFKGPDAPVDVVRRAVDAGMTFIDTARTYYNSENIVGEAVKGQRDRCVLATKTCIRKGAGVLKDVELSLVNLKTDIIDLYQLHNIDFENELKAVTSPGGALGMLKKAKENGKIRNIGVTGVNLKLMAECVKTGEIDAIQIPFDFIKRDETEKLIDLARAKDVGIIIMRPLAGGVLNAGAALGFLLSYGITTVIPSASSIEHVVANAAAGADPSGLSEADRARLLPAMGGGLCVGCGACAGKCPQGIPITGILRSAYYLPLSLSYARALFKKLGRLGECTSCGECERACPYGVPVGAKIRETLMVFSRSRVEGLLTDMARKTGLYDKLRNIYFTGIKMPVPRR
ncbi:MAG: aldo/keto reductase [Candidatus Omnitrophota bacterium]